MNTKPNDKLQILLSSVTLIIVALTLISVVFRTPGSSVTVPTITTTVSSAGHVNNTPENSNIILHKGAVAVVEQGAIPTAIEFNATNGQTVSGSYSSTQPVDFYVMTPSQLQYTGILPYDTLILQNGSITDMLNSIEYVTGVTLLPYNKVVANYTVSGAFESNHPTTLYIMTPNQYANYEVYDQISGYVYSAHSTSSSSTPINARIEPGTYYFVYYSHNAGYNYTTTTYQNTTATVQQSIIASPDYSIDSIYNATGLKNNTFSSYLPATGPYYLVWEDNNASGIGAAVQITSSIKLS